MTSAPRATDLERFRSVVARCFGLHFDDNRLAMLAEVLEKRLAAGRDASETYLARLESGGAPREELRALAKEITVGETYFFRNLDQYRAFAEIARPLRRLRVLSAGCASGEEAYSLAMIARDHGEPGTHVSITGVDLNPAALAKAARGSYSQWSLRETPADLKRRWFAAAGDEYTVDPSLRTTVRFEERNLADEEPALWLPESYDVVFCRNVLMYLTPETARAVVDRIGRALVPGGHLFLGHAETLRGLSSGFHLCHTHGTFYYRRKDAAESATGEPMVDGGAWPASIAAITDGAWAPSWVETVQRSATRIQELSDRSDTSAKRSVEVAPETARTDVVQAIDLLKHERFADALRALGEPPTGPSPDPDALLLRAVLLTLSGRLDEAEAACNDLCRLDELSAGAHYLLALCREGAGDRSGAEEHDRTAGLSRSQLRHATPSPRAPGASRGRPGACEARDRAGARPPGSRGSLSHPPLRRGLHPRGALAPLPVRALGDRGRPMNVVRSGSMLSAEELRRAFDGAFAAPSEERRLDLEPLLTLRIGSAAYAVRVLDIAGFATARRIVPLGSPLPAMLGLAAVRGSLFPVYSLEALLGDQATSEPPQWFLLCGHADPVALAFAHFEGHVLPSRTERLATSDGEGRRRHVRELVRVADEVRGVIDVSSLLETIQERVSASRPIKER